MPSYVWCGAGKHSTVLLNHLDISHPTTRTLDQGHVSYSLLAGAGLHSVLGDILRLNRVAMSLMSSRWTGKDPLLPMKIEREIASGKKQNCPWAE